MKISTTNHVHNEAHRAFIWKYLLVLVVLLYFCDLQAQNTFTVSGTIKDNEGTPLPGATIMIKGSSTGTSTDFDGQFELQLSKSAVLEISNIGFVTQEVQVTGTQQLDIDLQLDSQSLDEVVVVGYGTESKATVTSAISTVKGEELIEVPKNYVSSKLQGRLPGVSVQTIGGQPGPELQIRIREGSSIYKSNAPLVIVDGFQRSLSDLNSNDIESIDVLKDA